MRVEIGLPAEKWDDVTVAAKAGEAVGADSISTSELAHEPFLRLALATQATSNVELATSIAVAFPRSPMVVANMSWDLHANSGGRFHLGLGSQVKGHNVRRFSTPWTAAAPRLQEYVESIRAIWNCWENGAKLDYQGEHYQFTLMTPEFSPKPTGLPMPPISIAAVGPAMLRAGGRIADGVRLHGFCTRAYMEQDCMAQIEDGLRQSGRTREQIQIHGGGFIATGPDEETVAAKTDWARYRVAFYGSTRTYFPVWERHGLEDLGLKLHRMVAEGKWDKIAGEVDDDVVRLFAAVGTYDTIAKEIETRFKGADSIRIEFAAGTDTGLQREIIQDIQKIPTPFTAHNTADWFKAA